MCSGELHRMMAVPAAWGGNEKQRHVTTVGRHDGGACGWGSRGDSGAEKGTACLLKERSTFNLFYPTLEGPKN